MVLLAALQRVERQIQKNLDQIRAIGRDGHVFGQRMDQKLVVANGRVNAQQFPEVAQDLVGPDSGGSVGLLAQEAQVSAGDLDAVGDLAGDAFEAILDHFEVFAIHAGRVADALVDDLEEPGNHGQRAIDVVNDAGVNLASGAHNLFIHMRLLQFLLELRQFFLVGADLAAEAPSFERSMNGGAHAGDIERFVEIIASPEPQGLPDRYRSSRMPSS
jgi:hypothetical protein